MYSTSGSAYRMIEINFKSRRLDDIQSDRCREKAKQIKNKYNRIDLLSLRLHFSSLAILRLSYVIPSTIDI